MANVLKSLGTTLKSGLGKVLNGINNLAKNASTSSNLVSSVAGTLLDALIPDNVQEKMVAAAERDNVTKTEEVAKTVESLAIAQGITDKTAIAQATKSLTSTIAAESGTTITDAGSKVKTSIFAKAWALVRKYKYVAIAIAAAIVYYFGFNKQGKRTRAKLLKF